MKPSSFWAEETWRILVLILVAGAIGAAGGVVLAWIITRFGFEIAWAWRPGIYLLAVASAVMLTVVAGLIASARPLTVRPIAVLRRQ